jgi:quercetin 2,3-dioxygenase
MPAISADTLALPRIPDPGPAAADRPVLSVTTAPSGLEGEGFPVRRAFAGVDLAALDPSVHMDQMGESSTPRASPRAPPGTPTGASRPSPTCSTASSGTRTPTAAAASSPTAIRSG